MGGKSTSESKSGSGQEWARPIAQNAASNAQGVYDANQPQLQGATNNLWGMMTGLQANMGANNGNVKAAQGYNSDILSGKYLNGNPYLTGMIDQTNRSVGDQVNSQFGAAGRYGSGAFTDVLSRNLADAQNNLRYTDYNAQMGRMDQAASQAPGLAQANYIGLPEMLQLSQTAAGLPYVGSQATANSLAALFNGGTGTQTQDNGMGSTLQGLGSLASAAAMFSDRRLKRDIEKVGEFADGLGQYEWQYVWGGQRHRGVMADEVATLRPWALGPKVAGYATVNYGAL